MANDKLFPLIVGQVRIRDFDNNGKFFEMGCATNVKTTISTTETKELSCGTGNSVTLEKPSGSVTLKVIQTKNVDLLAKLLDLNSTSVVAGTNTITNKVVKFDSNGIVEMLERSNDGNGITGVIVKSKDGATTYTVATDYTVTVVDNKTTITRVATGSIPAGAEISVSGSINQRAYKETSIERAQRSKKKFAIELFGEDKKTGAMTTLYFTPVELDSEYLLEMIDAFRDGDIAGSELTFKLSDGGKITIKDENI